MTVLASRPNAGLQLEALSFYELQLITAYLYITRLSQGSSSYQDAAFDLLTKIEKLMGNKFIEDAAIDVDMKINVLGANGVVDRAVGYNWIEIDV